jgi:hypothetical protein
MTQQLVMYAVYLRLTFRGSSIVADTEHTAAKQRQTSADHSNIPLAVTKNLNYLTYVNMDSSCFGALNRILS